MFDDMTPRYVPEKMIVASVMKLLPVTQFVFHPAGTHEKSPIHNHVGAVECKTSAGSRWFGCDHAYINSELRMVIVGTPSRDEVRMKWQVCNVK